jgi:hypothetical protein
MTDYQGIKQQVKKLENDAHDIQNLMEEFFNTVSINKESIDGWETPTGDLELLHYQLILIYESWYNQSHMLIQNFYPKKESEFRTLHDNKESDDERPQFKGYKHIQHGISDTIQLKNRINEWETRQEILNRLVGSFKTQLAILIAIPEVIHLCKQDHDSERTDTFSKINSNLFIPNQTFNINSPYIDNSVHIQTFSQASTFIEKTIQDSKKKEDLLNEVKEFEVPQTQADYLRKYQKFVATLADHVTAFTPVLTFLLQNIPK